MPELDSEKALEIIADLARERFRWTGAVDADTRLVEDFGLDSLKALEMLIEIENRFEIRIDETAEEEIVTVGDLVRVIERALAAGPEVAE